MIKCEVIKTSVIIEGETRTVYGLEFYKNCEPKPFKTVKDIFIELKLAEELKCIINKNDISEVHIDEVIEDVII